MLEPSVKTGDSGIVPITQKALVNLLVALLSLTGLLMLFFVQIDFEYLFASDGVAMKVGKTVVFLGDFYEIKRSYGERGEKMSDELFAQKLLEIIMLAEEGRRLKLDRTPEFRRKIDDYDLASRHQTGTDSLQKAVFLIEELAQATRDYIIKQSLHDFAPEISELETIEPEIDRELAVRTTLEGARKDHESRALVAYLQVMRSRIDHYISPTLIEKNTNQPLSEGD